MDKLYNFYYIYLTTNIKNNKKYIGLHKTNALKDYYFGSGRIFLRAYKKYGKENFSKQIIEFCKNEEELKEREIFWIDYYNAANSREFYNFSKGGESRSGGTVGEGMKRRISKKLKEYYKNNPSACEKIRNRNLGRKATKESIEKQLVTRELKKTNYKPILVYKQDGTIEEYSGLKEMYAFYGKAISQIYKKGYIFYKNMLFIKKSENIPKSKAFLMLNSHYRQGNNKPVIILDIFTQKARKYNSIKDFCIIENYSISAVYSCINNKRIFHKNLKIKFISYEEFQNTDLETIIELEGNE